MNEVFQCGQYTCQVVRPDPDWMWHNVVHLGMGAILFAIAAAIIVGATILFVQEALPHFKSKKEPDTIYKQARKHR